MKAVKIYGAIRAFQAQILESGGRNFVAKQLSVSYLRILQQLSTLQRKISPTVPRLFRGTVQGTEMASNCRFKSVLDARAGT